MQEIVKEGKEMDRLIEWRPRKGKDIKFWGDRWLQNRAPRDLLEVL